MLTRPNVFCSCIVAMIIGAIVGLLACGCIFVFVMSLIPGVSQ